MFSSLQVFFFPTRTRVDLNLFSCCVQETHLKFSRHTNFFLMTTDCL